MIKIHDSYYQNAYAFINLSGQASGSPLYKLPVWELALANQIITTLHANRGEGHPAVV
jgi:hypothetical protein